jgi:hypothetical protein
MNRRSRAGRSLLFAVAASSLSLVALAGYGSSCASPSRSPAPLVNKPGAWPLALPVTPKPGEAFVGYWGPCTPWSPPQPSYLEVLKGPGGYQVSWNGQVPYSVSLIRGRLVLQTEYSRSVAPGGAEVRPGYELALENGQCVFYIHEPGRATPPGPMGPDYRQILSRMIETAYVKAVTGVADEKTKQSCNSLAVGVWVWKSKRGQGPPSPAEMRPGSSFVRWLTDLEGAWVWPTNSLTGRPMQISDQRGDFRYVVHGTRWTMRGNLSDGSTFNAKNPW